MAHFDDVHHPYRAHLGRSVPSFPSPNRNIAAYDRCIANFDNMLRFLTSHLKQAGVWDDTIVILTADHGEEFGEHGGAIHSLTCYVESVHVPLIVRIPGFKPQRISSRVALTDLAPTLIEAMSLPGGSLPRRWPKPVRSCTCTWEGACRPSDLLLDLPASERPKEFLHAQRSDGPTRAGLRSFVGSRRALRRRHRPRREPETSRQESPEVVEELRQLLGASATGNLWEARRFQ